MSTTTSIRLAVAQTTLREDDGGIGPSGREIRRLMREAREQGARVIHFPESATCCPHKDRFDWDRFDWAGLREELEAIAALAGELGLWTVLGSVHRLTPPHRPYNSLYVISETGGVVNRYDERLLSNTKVTRMYSPGQRPVTFEVDGVRFGCTLGMEAHFPEVFAEYERLDVDCVLFSTHGEGRPGGAATFAAEVQGHAAANSYWVSFAVGADQSPGTPSGVVAPGGRWLARCQPDGAPGLVVADLDETVEEVAGAIRLARPWRRRARAGEVYAGHHVTDDPRAEAQAAF